MRNMDPHKCSERHKGRFAKTNVLKKRSDFIQTCNLLKDANDYSSVPERRIVDLKHFGETFDKGCGSCNGRFLFKNIVEEKIKGLCSLIKFRCADCEHETTIATSQASGETHTQFAKSSYAVNLKAAIEMDSTSTAYQQESESMCSPVKDKGDTPHAMVETESLQKGWGHVIGVKTKKCLDYSPRVKNCAKCNFQSRTGKNVEHHDCRKNWTGSAKSMEPDIVTGLHGKSKDTGMKFIGVIGDEDSSSIKHIREKVNPEIKKYSDFGHLKRNLRGKLEKLQKENKSLSGKIKDSFLKNFSYAVKQNRTGTAGNMSKSIAAIVPHMFGSHGFCGKWCSNTNNGNDKHANLPKGKDLTDQALRLVLENVLAPFISNPGKLMTEGTTQPNESLNNVAWSKAPKMRNYNASESFDIRCSAGVAQFNDGIAYVNEVIEKSGLSPQKMTGKYTCTKDKQREYLKRYKREKHVKRRRFELKKKRLFVNTSSEIREGTTYESGCILKTEDIDTERIPDAEDFCQANEDAYTIDGHFIFYDLETTSLGQEAEIVQLSAISSSGEKFNKYVVPDGYISKQASAVNRITLSIINGEKVLCKEGKPIPGSIIGEALQSFIEWLRLLGEKEIILVAHNGKTFDMRILINSCIKAGCLDELAKQVHGFVDTLPLFRLVTEKGLSVSLVNMYQREFGSKYKAHDSCEDTQALMRLFFHKNLEQRAASSYMRFDFAVKYLKNASVVQRNRSEIERKLCDENKIISRYLARKIAITGLSFNHLQLAYSRDCVNGLRYVLGEKVNGKPRVTEKTAILTALNMHFEKNSMN